MALIVILASLTYPAIETMYRETRLQAGSDAVRAAWAEAQSHAVNEGRAYCFAVIPGKGNYRVAPDTRDANGVEDESKAESDSENPSYVLEESLPKGIVFPESSGHSANAGADDSALPEGQIASGQWVILATFLPDGTTDQDVELPLEYPGCRALTLHLRALTGTTKVQRGE